MINKTPKIYYVVNARMPSEKAHAIQIAKMCEAFVHIGAEVELVVPNRSKDKLLKEYYGLRQEIKVKKMPGPNLYGDSALGFVIGSLFFMVCYFLYLVSRKIKRENAVIYTVDMDNFSFSLIPFIGYPFFSELHNVKRKNLSMSFFLNRISGLIVINEAIKKDTMQKFGIKPEKIIVWPNGIDLEKFSADLKTDKARELLGLPQDKKIILYSGRLYDWKGLDILRETGELLREGELLYIVGGTKEIFEKQTGINCPPSVVCVGSRPFTEMPLWLSSADVLLVLGTRKNEYSYYFTSPMKIFEYMAIKKPIVSSATPAIAHILDEDEAYFYEPDNAESLVTAFRRAYSDQNSQRACGRAFDKVKQYTWNNRAANILNFIEKKI